METIPLVIRAAKASDREGVWSILEAVIRSADTYALPSDMSSDDALEYWFAPENEAFVAETDGGIVGTYYIRANQSGGGNHVANCGFMTAPGAMGRGIGRAMCSHSLQYARNRGYRAMQFNFVLESNERAIRLWRHFEFHIVGRLPSAFLHPALGYIDALIMYREL